MSYIQKTLLTDEKILYYTGPHPIIFFPATIWFFFAIVFFISGAIVKGANFFGISVFNILGNLALLLTLIYGMISYINYISSEYGITNKRVLMKIGFIRRNSLEIFLHKIESVHVQQSILGRILNYGIIIIAGTGGSKDPFPFIPDPLGFRHKVQEQIERISNEKHINNHD